MEVRTNDGRKMNLPSNLHGYSVSRPFLSPIVRGLVDSGMSNEGSVGHLNARKDVDDGTSVAIVRDVDEMCCELKASTCRHRCASTAELRMTAVMKPDMSRVIFEGFGAIE